MVLALAPAAFVAGVLMFLAPCTLPIVPGYLAFIAGGKGRVVRNALAFIVGFSLVFILLGTCAAFLGTLLGPWRDVLGRGAGVLIIIFGLTMLGVVRIPIVMTERRMRIPHFVVIGRWESSLLIGALFALGWSPCIGPILGTVLIAAGSSATALQGAFLLAIFAVGLGIPFLLCAIFITEVQRHAAKWSADVAVLERVGGVVLLAVGGLIVLGEMNAFIAWAYTFFSFLGYDRLQGYL